jgi:signal transduction histidine kinase
VVETSEPPGEETLRQRADLLARDRKRMEEEFRRRAEELLDADRRRNEFLALLAHELRNPLASIGNSIQILRTPNADANIEAQALAVMDRQLRSLARMIDDLIDVAAVTQGKIQLKREMLDLRSIASRAATQCGSRFSERNQNLTVETASEPLCMSGDPIRLEQVVANLLDNASKFSPRGGSTRLTVARENPAPGEYRAMAVVRVEDDGAGIPSEMLPRIFELFVQADHSLARTSGGLGIGLTIVRQLVEMHGGTVEARSPGRGAGSAFTVRLPLAPAYEIRPASEPADADAYEVPSRRVLVVDDIADSADTLAMRLRLAGHEVRVAYRGHDALRIVAEFGPEIVLLDIGLPEMDGYTVAREIRKLPGSEGIVLVALTGYDQSNARRMSAETGIHHHLTKPVDPAALRAILAGYE